MKQSTTSKVVASIFALLSLLLLISVAYEYFSQNAFDRQQAAVTTSRTTTTTTVSTSTASSFSPTGLVPASGSTLPSSTTNVTISWNAVPTATEYEIRARDLTDPTLHDPRNTSNNGTYYLYIDHYAPTSISLPVVSGHKYFFYVYASKANRLSDPSVTSFQVSNGQSRQQAPVPPSTQQQTQTEVPTTTYTLTISKTGTASGLITGNGLNCGSTCSVTLPAGTPIVLVPSIIGGSTFTGWLGEGCAGKGNCSFTLSGDTIILANFSIQSAVTQRDFSGFYILGSGQAGQQFDNVSKTDYPYIDGYAARVAWADIDNGSGGCDCADLDGAVIDLQNESTGAKKLSLNINGLFVPDYVYNASSLQYQFVDDKKTINSVAPWDTQAMLKYANFIKNLGDHTVNGVALRDSSTLTGIRIGIMGMDRYQSKNVDPLVATSFYDREKMIQAIIYNIHVVQDQFPKVPVWIQFFSTHDNDQTVNMDDEVLTAINAEFNGSNSLHPHIGMFQSSLLGAGPGVNGANGHFYTNGVTDGMFMNFQACDTWATHNLNCNEPVADNLPSNGFNLGYGNWGTRYYELYVGDTATTSVPWRNMLQTWHDFMRSPTTAPNPIGLTSTISGSNVVLQWNDTHTLEKNYIVEKSSNPTTGFVPFPDLAANTTSYTDLGAASSKSYYRVYGRIYNDSDVYAGSTIISNIVQAGSQGGGDIVPPVISLINTTSVMPTTAIVNWTTDELSTTQVEYGLTTLYGNKTTENSSLVLAHSNILTSLQPNTTYHYRVISKDGTGNQSLSVDGTFTTAVETLTQNPFEGIYVLGSGGQGSGTNQTASPFVDGFAMRTSWTVLSSSTAPVVDFRTIDDTLANLASDGASTGYNKKLSLWIDALVVPEYVWRNAPAGDVYSVQVAATGTTSYFASTTVPWSAYGQLQYQNFINVLSNHQVFDAKVGHNVALKDHSALADIRIGVLGFGKFQKNNTNSLVSRPEYTRTLFSSAALANIHIMKDAFPKTQAWVGFYTMSDDTSSPPLDTYMLGQLESEFDGVKNSHVGLWIESLRGDYPPPTASGQGFNLLSGHASGSQIGFQACGGWLNQSLCNFWPLDNNTANGFALGYGEYGSKYYEIYQGDLQNGPWAGIFQAWHDFLNGGASPVHLSVTPSGSQMNLSWTDAGPSTVVQHTQVDRSSNGTSWSTLSTLAPSSSSFNDLSPLTGSNYYRIHSYMSTSSPAVQIDYEYSNIVSANFGGSDVTPPTVAITSPANNATVSGTINVTANSSDNVGVAGVQFKLDGNNLGAEDTASPYLVSWNTASTTNGAHALLAVSRDTSNNIATSSAINVTVSNTSTNNPPLLATIGNKTVAENSNITFTISATDQDGDALTYSESQIPANATFNASTRTFSWTPDFTQSGSYTTTFTVIDGKGGSDFETITITVNNTNRPPILNTIGNKSINESSTLTFTLSATDPDSDALTYSESQIPSGAVFNQSTHTFTWTPNYNQAGDYFTTFTIDDGKGGTDSETIKITVANTDRAPTANAGVDQTITLPANVQLSASGSSDPDGDSLTYTWSQTSGPSGATFSNTHIVNPTVTFTTDGTYIFQVVVFDGILNNSDTIQVVVNPTPPPLQHTLSVTKNISVAGTVTSLPGGINCGSTCSANFLEALPVVLTAVPNAGYSFDSWTVSVGTCSDKLPCTVVMLTDISVTANFSKNNSAPVLNPIGDKSVFEGQDLTFTISATDPDGDALTYSATGLTNGATFNPLTRTFDWTPDFLQGENTFNLTFTVNDGRGGIDSEAINVVVHNTNRQPNSDAGPDQTITLPASATLSGFGSSDPDNDTLTYSWTQASGPDTASLSSPNSRDTDVTFDTEGDYTFTLTVSDGSLTSTDTMNVTVQPQSGNQNDEDNDGVPDSSDVCPGTPNSSEVNNIGCPLPADSEFTKETNLDNVDLKSISTFRLGTDIGNINFKAVNGPYALVVDLGNGSFGPVDLDDNITIEQGKITLNSTNLPQLNKPATLTMSNITVPNPVILRDGVICDQCQLVSYTNNTFVFTVPGFSTYEVVETPSYDLAITKSGKGSGTVTSDLGDINCGGTCSDTFNLGDFVTLTAISDDNSVFIGWTGACSGNDTCSIEMNSDETVDTQFDLSSEHNSTGGGGGGGGSGGTLGGNVPGEIPGCDPGNLFSTLNGQPCTGTSSGSVPGCLPGYLFSETTGQKCPETGTTGTSYYFANNLTLGSTGPDVVALQNLLIAQGYLVMPPGVSTGFFGNLTQSALAKYQVAHGISPAIGFFGPITRGIVNGGSSYIPLPPVIQPPVIVIPPPVSGSYVFTEPINPGESKPDVLPLQNYLVAHGYLLAGTYTPGLYDSASVQALSQFQITNGLFPAGSSSLGLVGPLTRAKLNSI